VAARRFPLAPRPKPPCRPLTERLARVARLAGQVADDADAPLRAAGACNLAALIASACAMPDLARVLCWAQFDAYQAARPAPCGETTAKLILQPLVNLARLRIRAGEADAGRQILQSLYDAARSSSGQAVIDGRAVSLPALIPALTTPAREALTQWLWAVLLTDSLPLSWCRTRSRAGYAPVGGRAASSAAAAEADAVSCFSCTAVSGWPRPDWKTMLFRSVSVPRVAVSATGLLRISAAM
jgi:hypothetical protein